MDPFPDDIFNLADIVLRVARDDPERIAVIDLDGWEGYGTRRYKRHTYAELSADVESVAVGLREMGIAELTRIVFMSPPSYESCVMGVALTRVGAFSIWIDPSVGYRNIAERLSRVKPEAFLGNALAHLGRITFGWGPRDLRKLVLTESPLLPGGRIITGFPPFPGARSIRSLRKHAPAEPEPPKVGPDDPCAVLYTTGSTGPAKPSLYLHRNFCQVFRNAHHSWRWDPDNEVPVDIAVFPAFLFIPISAGGTMVVPPIDFARQGPATVDPAALIQVINDCKVGSFFAAPILIENLAREALARNLTMPSLKRVIGAGAPISGPVERMLSAVMAPDGELAANYGATEAMPSTELGSREHLDGLWAMTEQGAGMCVGYALPGVEFKIIGIVDGPDRLHRGNVGAVHGASRRNPGAGQARESRVLPRPREHAQEQGARPTRGLAPLRRCRLPRRAGQALGLRSGVAAGEGSQRGRIPAASRAAVRRSPQGAAKWAGGSARSGGRTARPVRRGRARRGQGRARRLAPGTARTGCRFRDGEQDPCHPLQAAGCRWIRGTTPRLSARALPSGPPGSCRDPASAASAPAR